MRKLAEKKKPTLFVQIQKITLQKTAKLFTISLLCSIAVIAILSPSLLVYGQQSSLHGFVQNENGDYLGGVTVQILSGSSTVASCTSWSSGYFSFNNVNYGQYTINFIKSGYAQVEETVNVQSSETYLANVILPNAIQISTSTSTLITTPDAQFSIPFTIENLGTSTLTVDLVTSHPEGWYTRVWSGNYEVPKVTLSSGQSLNLELDIVVSSTSPTDQEYNVSISSIGTTNSSLNVLVLTRNYPSEIPTLNLQSSILSMVATSGEKLLLPFTVTNIGDATESFDFSVSTPQGWSTKIINTDGREITKASLSAGSKNSYNLELQIPSDYLGDTGFTLSVLGNTVASLDFTVNVEPVSQSILFCKFPGKLALPGDAVLFNVELTNPFNVETRFSVFGETMPENWTVTVKTQSGEAVTDILLGADESVSLIMDVESPTSEVSSATYDLIVAVESDGQKIGSLVLSAILEGDAEAVKITTKFPDVTIEAGEIVEYDIIVTNVGETNRVLFFNVTAPTNWKAVVKSGNLEISQLSIEAGSSETLTIQVTPPSTVSLGSYDIDVQFTSESGAVLGEKELTATVVGAYSLDLELSSLLKSTISGESVTFSATVTNTGYSYVTGVSLDFDVEDDWDVTINPIQVDNLSPQESCTFEVIVDTPSGTVSGDYMVTVGATSDESSSDQTQVRVTVTTSGSWAIYGVGVAAVLIVVLVLVFKKFKRR